jgi:predicted Fe-S protein YdhL (DUF1289 family)
MISPCRGVCKVDADTGWCIGCGRTLQERINWHNIDEQTQLDLIRRELKDRLQSIGHWPIDKDKQHEQRNRRNRRNRNPTV